MICVICKKDFNADEIDTDGRCYDCANADPGYKFDPTAIVKELIENTIQDLADAKKVSTTKIMSDFVAEHVYKHPEKYIEEAISKVTKAKKKNEPSQN